MDNVKLALIDLVNEVIGTKSDVNTNRLIELDENGWDLLYKESINHQVHLMIYNAVKNSPYIPLSLNKEWNNIYKFTSVRDAFKLSCMEKILQRFSELGIPVILLKGLYFKDLYPVPIARTMCDIDLLIDKHHLNNAIKLIKEFGYINIENDRTGMHYCFTHEKYIPIELHYSLVRSVNFKQVKDLNRVIWDKTNEFHYKNSLCLVPSDVNMAIYTCFHMANHYMYVGGGFGIRQLCDLILHINKNFDDEKWSSFIYKSNELGIISFTLGIIAVCMKYFFLYVPEFVSKIIELDNELVDDFFDEIFKSGAYGYSSTVESSNKALSQYSENINIIRFLFPPRRNLADAYYYARNNLLLLPIAWVHRFINNIIRKDISVIEKFPRFDIIKRHKRLVNWLKLK